MGLIGSPVVRKEDHRLITGQGTFTDDLVGPGTAVMRYVLSPHPHARVTAIDPAPALALDGVIAVHTVEDFGDYPDLPGPEPAARPVLARDRVRFHGEPVAVVLARSASIAADAIEAVEVTYEPLPAVPTLAEALAPDAVQLHELLPGNRLMDVPVDGDIEEALAAAPHRAELHLVNNRCAPTAIEPMTVLADWTGARLELHASFQAPHHLRNYLTEWLGIPQSHCRIVAPDVGGGFGSKIQWYPELFIAPLLSRWHGVAVRSVLTRSEALKLMYHGRAQEQDIEVGFDDEGRIHALRMLVTQDLGGYADVTGAGLPVLTTWMAAGCYRIPHVATGFRHVFTTTSPVSSYRGAGRPEATYAIERTIDLVADLTGVDAAEVRMRNFIPPDAFPFAQNTHEAVVYDSGDFPAALTKLLELMDYDTLKAEQAERREDPDAPLLGIGFSTWLEIAGFGPNGSLEGIGHLASWEAVNLRILPDGTALVTSGTSPHGQGHQTMLAQIASDVLGIEVEAITVRHGDTDTVQQGTGTFGSRSVSTAGVGLHRAATAVAERARRIAAHLLEADPDAIVLSDGRFHRQADDEASVGWAEVANASFQPLQLPEGTPAGSLEEQVYQESPNFTYPSGAYGCVVEVDRDTGQVQVRSYVAVDDCGAVINPLIADGQVHGGMTQGIAQALYEHVRYDDDGHLLTETLEDYLVPTAPDIPRFVTGRADTPTPNNELGAKGIGESGAVGSPPAVVNAVIDTLSHLGVRALDMPVTPERVWTALNEAKAAR